LTLDDDAIVVGMAIRRTTWSYLDEPETLRRRELEYGMVREPPAPFYDHQAVVTNLVALLAPRVRARELGRRLSPLRPAEPRTLPHAGRRWSGRRLSCPLWTTAKTAATTIHSAAARVAE